MFKQKLSDMGYDHIGKYVLFNAFSPVIYFPIFVAAIVLMSGLGIGETSIIHAPLTLIVFVTICTLSLITVIAEHFLRDDRFLPYRKSLPFVHFVLLTTLGSLWITQLPNNISGLAAIINSISARHIAGHKIHPLIFLSSFTLWSCSYVLWAAQIGPLELDDYVFIGFAMYWGILETFTLLNTQGHRRELREQRKQVESLNQQIKEQVLVRYLPPALINDIFEGKVSMDTKPATQEITVLFSDLSGFTKMSEEQGAETVADFLNDYLTVMNETIFQNNGTIDKFIGDAIMVLFGAPVPMSAKEQAENAARCARAMQAGMVLVNEKWKARGLNEVSMRIGIHQGTAVVGNFGSAQRVDYTAIGPSVNLASRIESACVPGEIFVSPEIRALLSPELTEQAGEYELKGISGKTSLYKLVRL